MKFFGAKEFFRMNFDLKIGVKMNLRIITKNHETDPELRFLSKSISKPYGRATPMPPAWELIKPSMWHGRRMARGAVEELINEKF